MSTPLGPSRYSTTLFRDSMPQDFSLAMKLHSVDCDILMFGCGSWDYTITRRAGPPVFPPKSGEKQSLGVLGPAVNAHLDRVAWGPSGVSCSMSRSGDALDNSVRESVFSTLKLKRCRRRRYR